MSFLFLDGAVTDKEWFCKDPSLLRLKIYFIEFVLTMRHFKIFSSF